MKRRGLFLLLGVFILLAIVALLQSRPSTPSAVDMSNQTGGVFEGYELMGQTLGMPVEEIAAIRLSSAQEGEQFIMSRDGTGNWIAPNETGTLDGETAANIAKTVVLLPYQTTLDITETTTFETYGFTPNGTLSIEILMRDGGTHAIAIGGLVPTTDAYYALVDELPQIFLLERAPVDYLQVQLDSPPVS